MTAFGYVLFYTSAAAFRAESLVKAAGRAGGLDVSPSAGASGAGGDDASGAEPRLSFTQARLVPTPRELSSDCGVALRFPLGIEGAMAALLDAEALPYERIVASPR